MTSRPKGVGCVFACSTASGKVQAHLYIEIFGMMSSEKIHNKNLAWCDLKGKRMFPSWFKVWSSSWHSPMGGHSLRDRTNQSLLTKSMCLLIWLQFFEHFDDCSHLWRSMIPFWWTYGITIDQDKFPGVANKSHSNLKLTSLDHSHFCVTCTTITSLNKECLCFGGVAFH